MWSAAHLFVRVFTRLNDGKHCVLTTLDKQGEGVRFTAVSDSGEMYDCLQGEVAMDMHRRRVCGSLGVGSITWLAFYEMIQQSFVERNLTLADGARAGQRSKVVDSLLAESGVGKRKTTSVFSDDIDDDHADAEDDTMSGTLTSNMGVRTGTGTGTESESAGLLDVDISQPELVLTINVKPLSQMSTAEAKLAPVTLSLRRAQCSKTTVGRLSGEITSFIGLRTGDRREMEKVEDLLRSERAVRHDAITTRESYDILLHGVNGLQFEIEGLERELEEAQKELSDRCKYEKEQQQQQQERKKGGGAAANSDVDWKQQWDEFSGGCLWERLVLHVEDPMRRTVQEVCNEFGAGSSTSIVTETSSSGGGGNKNSNGGGSNPFRKNRHSSNDSESDDPTVMQARKELVPGVVPGLMLELRKACSHTSLGEGASFSSFNSAATAPASAASAGSGVVTGVAKGSSSSENSSNASSTSANSSNSNGGGGGGDGSSSPTTAGGSPGGGTKSGELGGGNGSTSGLGWNSGLLGSGSNLLGSQPMTSSQIISLMNRHNDFTDPSSPALAASIFEASEDEHELINYIVDFLSDWRFNVYQVEALCVRAFEKRVEEMTSGGGGGGGGGPGRERKSGSGGGLAGLNLPNVKSADSSDGDNNNNDDDAAAAAAAGGRKKRRRTITPAETGVPKFSSFSVDAAAAAPGPFERNLFPSSSPALELRAQYNGDGNICTPPHDSMPLAPPGVLFFVGYVVFTKLNLLKLFGISERKLVAWLRAVEMGYRQGGAPFHNSVRAADVLQTVYCLIAGDVKRQVFSDRYCLILVIAATLSHYGHPGNYDQLPQAVVDAHGPAGALQRHHAAAGLALLDLPQYDILDQISDASRRMMREYIGNIIVAADLSAHDATMSTLRVKMSAMDLPTFLQTESCMFLSLVVKLGTVGFCARESDAFANAVRDLLAESAGRSTLLECGDCCRLLHGGDVEDVVPKASDANVSALLNLLNTVALPMFAMMGEIFSAIRPTGQNILANKTFASGLRKSS